MATIRDVARKAGVAISTVSAVLNGSAPVSATAREAVEAAIRATGYRPNRGAQSLRRGQSRLIGIVVADIDNPHFTRMAKIVQDEALQRGYLAFVYATSENAVAERDILRQMRDQGVAGLIHVPTSTQPDHLTSLAGEIAAPAVLFDRTGPSAPFPSVTLDNRASGRLVAEHLLGLGHRRIAVIGGREGVATGDERIAGFRDAFEHAGGMVSDLLVTSGGFLSGQAHDATLRLLAREPRPTAIFSINNQMTIGAMQALHEAGLRCPEQISVVGVDDFPWADALSPRLTLVAQPTEMMARAAADMLFDAIGSPVSMPASRVFAPELVIRESCRRL